MKPLSHTVKEEINNSQIIDDFEIFIRDCLATYADCYVGLSNNPEIRINEEFIIEGHTADGRYKKGDPVIVRNAKSNENAIKVETHFHGLGAQGGNGPGTGIKTSIYAYCIIDRLIASKAVLKIIDDEKTRQRIIDKGDYIIRS
ncbi:hypothetical protein KK062_22560 [Fulvivirgaceae bacterium PWU5]|uniref:Uncharacterized protein n=1 Tax=Dawidia cretensis TaxID=2782350 RepID=A0AAP2GWP4_9BACT|nr:hypothetical protein [Dawidia cretensis]MBT1711042.1 hypothetical protein [Dawidia cretensis]